MDVLLTKNRNETSREPVAVCFCLSGTLKGFANWTVLDLEEVLISMFGGFSGVKKFRFNSKTQFQMFLSLYNSFQGGYAK